MSKRQKGAPKFYEELDDYFLSALRQLLAARELIVDQTTDAMAVLMTEEAARLHAEWAHLGDEPPEPTPGFDALKKEATEGWRCLERHGYGRFVVGRRGHKSRFVFQRPAGLRKQLEVDVKPGSSSAAGEPRGTYRLRAQPSGQTSIITHRHVLRPNFVVELSLPSDLTAAEATRLARFAQTLSFEEHDRAGYERLPPVEFDEWDKVTAWPED